MDQSSKAFQNFVKPSAAQIAVLKQRASISCSPNSKGGVEYSSSKHPKLHKQAKPIINVTTSSQKRNTGPTSGMAYNTFDRAYASLNVRTCPQDK